MSTPTRTEVVRRELLVRGRVVEPLRTSCERAAAQHGRPSDDGEAPA